MCLSREESDIIRDDFEGSSFEETSSINKRPTKYFDIPNTGNVKELKIIDNEGGITWSKVLLEQIFVMPKRLKVKDSGLSSGFRMENYQRIKRILVLWTVSPDWFTETWDGSFTRNWLSNPTRQLTISMSLYNQETGIFMTFYISILRNTEGLYLVDYASRYAVARISHSDDYTEFSCYFLIMALFVIALLNISINRKNSKMMSLRKMRIVRLKAKKRRALRYSNNVDRESSDSDDSVYEPVNIALMQRAKTLAR